MSTHAQLDLDLAKLAGMLPIWLEKLRTADQFWPQFDALGQEILDDAPAEEIDYVKARLERMLKQQHMVRPARFGKARKT